MLVRFSGYGWRSFVLLKKYSVRSPPYLSLYAIDFTDTAKFEIVIISVFFFQKTLQFELLT